MCLFKSHPPGLDGLVALFPRVRRSERAARGSWSAGGGGGEDSTVGQARHRGRCGVRFRRAVGRFVAFVAGRVDLRCVLESFGLTVTTEGFHVAFCLLTMSCPLNPSSRTRPSTKPSKSNQAWRSATKSTLSRTRASMPSEPNTPPAPPPPPLHPPQPQITRTSPRCAPTR